MTAIDQQAAAPAADYLGNSAQHGVYEALPEDLTTLDPAPCYERLDGSDQVELSAAEIRHFKSQGFIVKRGLIDDRAALAGIVDYLWRLIPDDVMSRDDPHTWSDGPESRLSEEDAARLGPFSHGTWKLRSPGGVGTEPQVLDMSVNHPRVRRVVAQFIGPGLRPTCRARGIYAIFPRSGDDPVRRLGVHGDIVPSDLSAMVMVADTPPRTGGFTIWPGSHRELHRMWDTRHGSRMTDPRRIADYVAARNRIVRTVRPVECTGSAGDVVFWHPRLLHSAGVNYSRESTPRVRFIIPCDFQRDGYSYFDDDEFGPGSRQQWWIDTRNYHEDLPPGEDLWRDWAI